MYNFALKDKTQCFTVQQMSLIVTCIWKCIICISWGKAITLKIYIYKLYNIWKLYKTNNQGHGNKTKLTHNEQLFPIKTQINIHEMKYITNYCWGGGGGAWQKILLHLKILQQSKFIYYNPKSVSPPPYPTPKKGRKKGKDVNYECKFFKGSLLCFIKN